MFPKISNNTSRWVFGAAFALMFFTPLLSGCGRTLTIYRDEVINTEFDRNGVPMDVDVVTLFPSDFKGELEEINRDLMPGSGITADMWFKNKPTRDSAKDPEDRAHYRIPRDRIYSFAEKKEATFGMWEGGQIQGNKYRKAGEKEIVIRNIPVGGYSDDRSVIFVFCRFTDARGAVLATKPAEFRKLSRYSEDLAVRIRAKSVERLTQPKFDKDYDDKNRAN